MTPSVDYFTTGRRGVYAGWLHMLTDLVTVRFVHPDSSKCMVRWSCR